MLDLGVGSGAILLSVLAERPAAKGLGVDISEAALATARDNAAAWAWPSARPFFAPTGPQGLPDEAFDLVTSNPPYIPTGDIEGLEPEVSAHEPRLALDGGPDGLSAYRVLAPEILRVLKPEGRFAVEIGWDQGPAVKALFEQAGAQDLRVVRDLSDRDRVVAGCKKALGIRARPLTLFSSPPISSRMSDPRGSGGAADRGFRRTRRSRVGTPGRKTDSGSRLTTGVNAAPLGFSRERRRRAPARIWNSGRREMRDFKGMKRQRGRNRKPRRWRRRRRREEEPEPGLRIERARTG